MSAPYERPLSILTYVTQLTFMAHLAQALPGRLSQQAHNTRTLAACPPRLTCGPCAPSNGARCPADLRRPPAGVCLRRSRPNGHPHPKGTPRLRSGTAPASGGAGRRTGKVTRTAQRHQAVMASTRLSLARQGSQEARSR